MAKDKKLAEQGKKSNSEPVHLGKKRLKERAASHEASSFNNNFHATAQSLRITKDKKFKRVGKGDKKDILEAMKNKKRKLEDKGMIVESSDGGTSTIRKHESSVVRGHKIRMTKSDAKKSGLLEKKIRKKENNKVDLISGSVLPGNDNQSSDDTKCDVKAPVLNKISSSQSTEEASNEKTSKGKKKKKINKIIKNQGNQILEKRGSPTEAEAEDVDEIASNEKTSKGKKKKKMKKTIKSQGIQILEKQSSPSKAESEDVDEIQSVDEDCTRGMKKWLNQYHENRPGLEILQNRIDEFMTSYEAQKEQERKEREAEAAEGGWTVVLHHKGRKKTTDSESGITVGSVARAAVIDNMAKKKPKEVPIDFYRFQRREAQRNEIMLLQSKFEQDKKRIQQLRASRKFRPY